MSRLPDHRPAGPTSLVASPFAPAADAATCRARIGVLQALLDGLFEAACVIDGSSLTVLGMNPAAAAQLGVEPHALLGRPVADLVASPEDHHFWLQAQDSLRVGLCSTDTHLSLHSDTLIQRADGELASVERRIVPIELPSGHPAWLLAWQDHSAQHRAEAEVDRLAAELGATLEGSRDALLVTDLDGAVRGCNQAFLRLVGLSNDTAANDARLAHALRALADDRLACDERWQRLLANPLTSHSEPIKLADGRMLEWHSVAQYAQGVPVGRVHAWRDVTQVLADAARLRVATEVFDNARDAVFVIDAAQRIVAANRAAGQWCGQALERLAGESIDTWLWDPNQPEAVSLAIAHLSIQPRWEGELVLRGTSGDLQVKAVVTEVPASKGHVQRWIVNLEDLRERRAQEQALHALTHKDPLTGLPNRQCLSERVAGAIEQATRNTGGFALLSVGIDRFAELNDTMGHGVGDAVLLEVARRLAGCVRQDDMVARVGGDSFVLLLDQADSTAAELIACRVTQALNQSLRVAGQEFSMHASIGAALYPANGTSMDDLVKNADLAMHHVRRSGGDLRFFEPRMNSELLAKVRLDHAMREALVEQRFELHYQPQISLADGSLTGVEALLRWHDPVLGQVSPGSFIPVAEETGFIVELGDHVLCMAIERAARWHAQGARIPVAVNISALQFQQPGFVNRVIELIDAAGLPADLLELELTEGVLVGDINAFAERLQALADKGISLAVDDFGTGYSSLSYLKRLPIDCLKIDRSFVQGLPDDASDAAIVRSIIDIGRALKLHVVAEGVETEAQRDCLIQAGCDEAQGYLYAKPLPVAQFERRYGIGRAGAVQPTSLRRLA
jgi:diguanylate cyclase (GGDEF)-like protein/PAS domain S-box-containing protein